MDYSYALMDLTVYGRQESWEDSPPGRPQQWQVDSSNTRTNGRSTAQWSRLELDALTTSAPPGAERISSIARWRCSAAKAFERQNAALAQAQPATALGRVCR